MQIVAIGGGELKDLETLRIDKFVIELTGKRNPKALFIPTASGDPEGYCNTFDRVYGKRIGCRTSSLRLLSSIEDRKHAEEKILESDLVYVGGGNTLRMMKLWRRLGVDRILESAGNQGTVLSGLSSGAICWHDFGFSDSRAFSGRSEWSFIRVRGLGYHRGIFCPHLDAEKRKKPFSQMIQRYGSVGIACDNNAAIWYSNEKAFAKATNRKAGVHIFQRESREVRVARYNEGERIEFANPSLQLNSHGSGISENGS